MCAPDGGAGYVLAAAAPGATKAVAAVLRAAASTTRAVNINFTATSCMTVVVRAARSRQLGTLVRSRPRSATSSHLRELWPGGSDGHLGRYRQHPDAVEVLVVPAWSA